MRRPSSLLVLLLAVFACAKDPQPTASPSTTATPAAAPADDLFAPAADLVAIRTEPDEEATPGGGGAPVAQGALPAVLAEPPTPEATEDRGLGTEGGRTLSQKQLLDTIKRNQPKVRACYERGLKSNNTLAGKLVLAWTVGADGRVRAVETISDSVRHGEVVRCIRKTVGTWVFPRAESPSEVEYPFVLKSNGL